MMANPDRFCKTCQDLNDYRHELQALASEGLLKRYKQLKNEN